MANGEKTTKRRSAKRVARMPRRRKSTRPRRKKRFNSGRLLGRLAIVAAILAVGWWGFGFVRDALMGSLVKTVVATAGTVEQVVAGDGWLMPTIAETQVAPLDGMVYLKIPDGERVRVGDCVAEIVDPGTQRELVDQLSGLDKQLADVRQRNAAERDAATKRIAEIEALLPTKLSELQSATAKGDQTGIAGLQQEIRDLGSEKQTLEQKLAALDASESQLAGSRQQVSDTISRSAYQMLALSPGVVSYRFDGLDDTLSPDKAIALGSRGLWSLREQPATLKDQAGVMAGQPVLKVLDPGATYVALAIKADQLTDLGQGQVTLRFSGFARDTVSAEFVSAGQPERNGYIVAVYRTADFLPEFGQTRRISIEIVKSAGSGLVVPVSSLVTRKGATGVWVVKVGTARFTPVEILSSNGVFAAVGGLTDGAEVVKIGRMIFREGQRIK